MSKYKRQHGGRKGKKIQAGVPPLFGQWPKEFFLQASFPYTLVAFYPPTISPLMAC